MRVLIVSPSYPPATTGEAEHASQISTRLARLSHTVTLLTNRAAQAAPPQGFELRAEMAGWQWRHGPKLWAEIRRARPDVVLLIYTAWLYDGHPMVTFLPSLLNRLMPQVRLLSLFEIADGSAAGGWQARLGRKLLTLIEGPVRTNFTYGTLLSRSAQVLAMGPSVLATLAQHDPQVHGHCAVLPPPPLIPPPADLSAAARSAARARLGLQPGVFVWAYFGYVYAGKGVETLIAAFKQVRDQGHAVHLLMAGGGREGEQAASPFEAQIRQQVAALGLAPHVTWSRGYSSGSDAPTRDLMAADAAVLPFDDGAELRRSSLAVVAAVELPIVTTTPGPHETAFVDGVNTLICPPRDPQALAAAVTRLIVDPALRQCLREGAGRLGRDWFSWEATMRQLDAAFQGQGQIHAHSQSQSQAGTGTIATDTPAHDRR